MTAAAPVGLHRIAAVARETGVSEHALRVWERRYGALASHRSPAGYRLYTDDDISRVRTIKDLIDLGYAVGEVAALPLAELLRLRERARTTFRERPSGPLVESMRARFLDAIDGFDTEVAGRLAASWSTALTPEDQIAGVIAPLLIEIGRRWEAGRLGIAQEHAASAVIRAHLSGVLAGIKPPRDAPVILATTPSEEQHELGALMAAVVAASAGARMVYLGPNLPPTSTAAAVKGTDASVVLVSVIALDPHAAAGQLLALRRTLPRDVAIWIGGASVQESPGPGITWIRTLDELRLQVKALAL